MDLEAIRASLGYRPLECQICAGVSFAGPSTAAAHFATAHPSLVQPQLRPCLDLDLEDDVERLLAKAKASSPAKSLLSSASLADAPTPLEPRSEPQNGPSAVQPEASEEEAEELDGPIEGMEGPDEEGSSTSSPDDAFCSIPDDSPAKSPAQDPESHSPAASPQPPACVCRQCALCRLAETEAGVAAHLRQHHKVAPSSDLSPLILRRPPDDCDCRLSFPDASNEEEEEPSFVHASLDDLPTTPARPLSIPASASTDGSQNRPVVKPQSSSCRLCGVLVTTDSSILSVLRQHQANHVYKAHLKIPVISCNQCGRSWDVPRKGNALKHARTHVETDAEAKKLICDETSKHLQRFSRFRRQCFGVTEMGGGADETSSVQALPSETARSSATDGKSQSSSCQLCGERLTTSSKYPTVLQQHQARHVYKAHLKKAVQSCRRCGYSWSVPNKTSALKHARSHVETDAKAKRLICDETGKYREGYRGFYRRCFPDAAREGGKEGSTSQASSTDPPPSESRAEPAASPSEASAGQSKSRKLRTSSCRLCEERLAVRGSGTNLWRRQAAHVHEAHLREVQLSCRRCGRSWHQPKMANALRHARTHVRTPAGAKRLIRDETSKHRRRYQSLYKSCFAQ